MVKLTAFVDCGKTYKYRSKTLYFNESGALEKREPNSSGSILKGHESFSTSGPSTFEIEVPAGYHIDQFAMLPTEIWAVIAETARRKCDEIFASRRASGAPPTW